ncbi:electron transport complex subunit RsxG [Thalassotalea fusca]
MKDAIQKNAMLLAIYAIVATTIVGIISLLTQPRIERQEQAQLLNTLASIIEPSSHNNDLYQDCHLLNDQSFSSKLQTYYIAKKDDNPVAIAITTSAPDGYNGNIDLIVAMTLDGTVSGVRTLKHQETPGLGDKIELRKDDWILSFADNHVESEKDMRWGVRKDGGVFDQFTGATITPRAVVNTVKRTVLYVNEHKDSLLANEQLCRSKS